MKFHLVIEKSKFYVYQFINDRFEPEYINGNPFWNYEVHAINDATANLLTALANANNLDDTNDIEVSVILNSDRVRNVNVMKALDGHVREELPLENILIRVIKALEKNAGLKITDFGINYDGDSYILREGKLEKMPYSLLAYTVHQKEFMAMIMGR